MFVPIRVLVFFALLAAAPMLRAAVNSTPPALIEEALILRVDGDLTFDQQGVPIDYRIETTLPQQLNGSLQRLVRSWRFDPVRVGGKPVVAQTKMRVTLAAQGTGATYRVTVDDVSFPQTRGQAGDAPDALNNPATISYARPFKIVYPREAIEYGLSAKVVLVVRLNPEGRVEQSAVEQTSLFNVKGKPADLSMAAALFERQVLDSVKSWRFNVVTNVPNPTARDLTVRIPIRFSVEGTVGADDPRRGWQQVVRTPLRTAPWLPTSPDSASAGIADVIDRSSEPAATSFRLTAPVIGTVL